MTIPKTTMAQIVAGVLSLGLVALMVSQTSKAVFSGQTDNPGNSWATGGVAIGDDDTGTALFTSAGDGTLTGGQVLTKCIAVTYTGNTIVGTAARLYAASSGALAPYLDLRIREGSGGGYGNCGAFVSSSTLYTGTLSGFSTASSNFANGVSTWSPSANPQTRTFEFQITVQNVVGAQNKTAAGSFTWEVQG